MLLEILLAQLPRAKIGNVVTPLSSSALAAAIRRLTGVVVMRASRTYCHTIDQAGLLHFVPEHAMGRRTTADVTHTQKQHAEVLLFE